MPGLNLLEALKHHLATGETPESIRETQGGQGVRTVPLAESPVSSDSGFAEPPVRSGRSYAPGAGRSTTSKERFSIEDLEGGAGNAGQVEAFQPKVSPAGEVEPPLPFVQPAKESLEDRLAAPPPLSHAQRRRYWEDEHAPADSRDRAPVARKPAPPTRLTTDQTLAEDLAASLALTGEAEALAQDPGAEATFGVSSACPDSPCEIPTALADLPLFAYVSGPAGVGKTYWAKKVAAEAGEACVLAATTGIASVNLGEGTTINALLKYFDTASLREAYTGGYLEAILKKHRGLGLERILLDEVSMMAGEQLTIITRAIDNVNQDKPEGVPDMGLILLGDFCQLSPVPDRDPSDPRGFKKLPVSFAFESAEWDRYGEHSLKLTQIRRQADRAFVEALQAVRRGAAGAALEYFRDRMVSTTDMRYPGPTIVAKNEAVGKYNQLRLDAVQGAKVEFASQRWGKVRPEWGAKPKPEGEWGVPETLRLKEGCRVMVLANKNVAQKDEPPRWAYTNGDLGTFLWPAKGGDQVVGAYVKLDRTGTEVVVGMLNRFNEIPMEPGRRKALKAEGHPERISDDGRHEFIGGIEYLPLRLAYASTVHRSQGLSLDQVQVNIRDPFFAQPSMLYVAMSRARTVEGLRLVGTPEGFRARCTVNPKLKGYL